MPYRDPADPARLLPDERYQRDSHFRALVDMMHNAIAAANYTPTEMREAAILAAIHYEMRREMPALRVVIDPKREQIKIMSDEEAMRFIEAARHREPTP